ncbi:hypothetical protein [Nocardia vermiculata]|uniref:Mce protein n=1 Tax=Nocardia vermiculata TaxID=257274 RepID=A0A846Y8V5_9NOCA|nr:hypothetical protein [Nocardia vermiculata]NKY53179.1 hypothetical protein [Nocardia vermiculata]
MSESKDIEGRTRRRAVRTAGPVKGGNAPEVQSVAVTSGTGGSAAGTTADTDSTVKLGTASATTGKTGSADADSTAKLSTAGTAESGAVAASDPTVKVATAADEDATVKLASSAADGSDTDAGDPADPEDPAADAAQQSRRLGKLGWAAAVVAVISLVGLLGAGGFYFYHDHQANTLAERRADYVQTAKQAVLNLSNIKGDSAQQDIDRVLAVASGPLQQEYSQRKDAYAKVIEQAKVQASGEIIEAALESSDDHTARVLVAAKQTLTNAGSPEPQQRYYRFRVTVTRDNGHTTASQVEFVA